MHLQHTGLSCVRHTLCAAGVQNKKVVGMGSCGLDYLAQVDAFPKPDAKIRTQQLEVLLAYTSCLYAASVSA